MKCKNCNKEMNVYEQCGTQYGICTNIKCKFSGFMKMNEKESIENAKKLKQKFK